MAFQDFEQPHSAEHVGRFPTAPMAPRPMAQGQMGREGPALHQQFDALSLQGPRVSKSMNSGTRVVDIRSGRPRQGANSYNRVLEGYTLRRKDPGDGSKLTWAMVSQTPMRVTVDELCKLVKTYEREGYSVCKSLDRLAPNQHIQVDNLATERTREERDDFFEWILVYVKSDKKVSKGWPSIRETTSIKVILEKVRKDPNRIESGRFQDLNGPSRQHGGLPMHDRGIPHQPPILHMPHAPGQSTQQMRRPGQGGPMGPKGPAGPPHIAGPARSPEPIMIIDDGPPGPMGRHPPPRGGALGPPPPPMGALHARPGMSPPRHPPHVGGGHPPNVIHAGPPPIAGNLRSVGARKASDWINEEPYSDSEGTVFSGSQASESDQTPLTPISVGSPPFPSFGSYHSDKRPGGIMKPAGSRRGSEYREHRRPASSQSHRFGQGDDFNPIINMKPGHAGHIPHPPMNHRPSQHLPPQHLPHGPPTPPSPPPHHQNHLSHHHQPQRVPQHGPPQHQPNYLSHVPPPHHPPYGPPQQRPGMQQHHHHQPPQTFPRNTAFPPQNGGRPQPRGHSPPFEMNHGNAQQQQQQLPRRNSDVSWSDEGEPFDYEFDRPTVPPQRHASIATTSRRGMSPVEVFR
ncbi:MAG: hypothetical protein M1825_005395 [Sarcosagium campestre]|nr:MAG: hypothetical protein M1825_005395 [Sarcosagium campestre]